MEYQIRLSNSQMFFTVGSYVEGALPARRCREAETVPVNVRMNLPEADYTVMLIVGEILNGSFVERDRVELGEIFVTSVGSDADRDQGTDDQDGTGDNGDNSGGGTTNMGSAPCGVMGMLPMMFAVLGLTGLRRRR